MFTPSHRAMVALSLLVVLHAGIHAAPMVEEEHPDVPAYVKALKSANATVRKEVATALGELGARARSAVPALRAALLDSDESVQLAAAQALEKISGPAKKPAPGDAAVKALEARLKALQEELEKNAAELRAANAKLIAGREAERDLNKEVRERELKIKELQAAADQWRDKSIQAALKLRALQERSEALLRQLEEGKSIEFDGKERADRRPPPEDVEGIVKQVDEKAGLCKISIGKEAGLAKGRSLHVYRLSPKPQYLGELRIVDVEAREATAKFTPAQRATTLTPGDIVTSNLEGQRKK